LYFPGALRNDATREATVSGAAASAAFLERKNQPT
jgi:hypothetical protein